MSFSIFSGMYLKMRELALERLNFKKTCLEYQFYILKKNGGYFSNMYEFIYYAL